MFLHLDRSLHLAIDGAILLTIDLTLHCDAVFEYRRTPQ
jgi:hypothetical protein